jgi:protein-L-isoaspartate(D-aspartate) O-methyltransferase
MKLHEPSVTIDDHHRPRWATVTAAALVLATVFGSAAAVAAQSEPFALERHRMVDEQVRQRGIEQPRVLEAMENVPRHLFVPDEKRRLAYEDVPVEIYPDQTLSQAYVSARMISLLELDGDEKVLEIGTGSGYDAALLSRMAREVYTIEIQEELYRKAERTLDRLGYRNVHARAGDGYNGWPEEAPFDAILVTAAPERLPEPLLEQLRVGGKMVIAVGNLVQELQVITKTADGLERRKVSLVNLVPMTGQAANEH